MQEINNKSSVDESLRPCLGAYFNLPSFTVVLKSVPLERCFQPHNLNATSHGLERHIISPSISISLKISGIEVALRFTILTIIEISSANNVLRDSGRQIIMKKLRKDGARRAGQAALYLSCFSRTPLGLFFV